MSAGAVAAGCTAYGCRPPRGDVGAVPYIVRPMLNMGKYIPYVIIGVQRAWFIPPEEEGGVVRVRLETVAMNLGACGSPPKAQVQTMVVGMGKPLPQNTPVTFAMSGPADTYHIGCTESDSGRLTFTLDSCVGGTVAPSWFVLNTGNRFQPAVATGSTCTAHTPNARVLRAMATLDPDVFELAWREPASTEGVDAYMLFLV